eukprot:Colp12_sorted_trinity150504_noHs@1990
MDAVDEHFARALALKRSKEEKPETPPHVKQEKELPQPEKAKVVEVEQKRKRGSEEITLPAFLAAVPLRDRALPESFFKPKPKNESDVVEVEEEEEERDEREDCELGKYNICDPEKGTCVCAKAAAERANKKIAKPKSHVQNKGGCSVKCELASYGMCGKGMCICDGGVRDVEDLPLTEQEQAFLYNDFGGEEELEDEDEQGLEGSIYSSAYMNSMFLKPHHPKIDTYSPLTPPSPDPYRQKDSPHSARRPDCELAKFGLCTDVCLCREEALKAAKSTRTIHVPIGGYGTKVAPPRDWGAKITNVRNS